ncbi:VOC family protein [Granulicella sp. S156]|uniref:VOC family protein n=1 Tax=Granulicella sp. S156 TaxID=1747224 RepID=UPI00131CD258|nr:VOC family protein [Granulicella sp. S156]
MISPRSIDHLVFRVSDLDRTEPFYTALLGQPSHRAEDSLMYSVGETRLFFTTSTEPRAGTYDKEKIGLNHIAFGVRSLTELEAIREQLDNAGISHSGIRLDHYGLKEFIWLDDPDGQRIEFYLRPEQE